jgi:DNA-binding CsgD family transcriptional regulator
MSEERIIERQTMVEAFKRLMPQLTRRQLECLVLFQAGLTQQESGEALGVARRVVCEHLEKVWEKLG